MTLPFVISTAANTPLPALGMTEVDTYTLVDGEILFDTSPFYQNLYTSDMAHNADKLCYTTNSFVVNNGRVLLIFHSEYSTWFGPGGHIEKDEDPLEAAYREIQEETGLAKNDLELIQPAGAVLSDDIFTDMEGRNLAVPHFIDVHRVSSTHFHLAFRYFFSTKKESLVSSDSDIQKLKWFTRAELNSPTLNLREHVSYYANRALDLETNNN